MDKLQQGLTMLSSKLPKDKNKLSNTIFEDSPKPTYTAQKFLFSVPKIMELCILQDTYVKFESEKVRMYDMIFAYQCIVRSKDASLTSLQSENKHLYNLFLELFQNAEGVEEIFLIDLLYCSVSREPYRHYQNIESYIVGLDLVKIFTIIGYICLVNNGTILITTNSNDIEASFYESQFAGDLVDKGCSQIDICKILNVENSFSNVFSYIYRNAMYIQFDHTIEFIKYGDGHPTFIGENAENVGNVFFSLNSIYAKYIKQNNGKA